MLNQIEMVTSITNKIRSYEARRFCIAVGEGTDEAWKRYESEMVKYRDFINSEIEKWNVANGLDEVRGINKFSKEEFAYWLEKNC